VELKNKKLCQSGYQSFTCASFQGFVPLQSSGQTLKNNLMKKYITFDNVAYSMALLTFLFIAVTLCSACAQLHERTHAQTVSILDELEKPL
jgi:hypothetical protein